MISHPLHGQTALPLSIDRLPTLILAECVLVYLDPDHSANIIDYFGKRLQNAAFLVYEQVCVRAVYQGSPSFVVFLRFDPTMRLGDRC